MQHGCNGEGASHRVYDTELNRLRFDISSSIIGRNHRISPPVLLLKLSRLLLGAETSSQVSAACNVLC
jgi:hypothetical protein